MNSGRRGEMGGLPRRTQSSSWASSINHPVFEIAVGRAFSIKNESCCTCQRHGEGVDVRFIFRLAAAHWGASNLNSFN